MENKILVLLPFYNRQSFLKESITSILNQTHSNLILALIDDCSTDSSVNVVKSFSDPRIRLFSNRVNRGPYYSLNVALSELKDEYWTHFMLHGSDDVSHLTRIQKQLNLFTGQPVAVGCLFERVDYATKRRSKTNSNSNESMLMMSRKVFDTIGYFDNSRFAADTEYKKRILLGFDTTIPNVNSVLLNAYSHSKNLTKTVKIGGVERKQYVAKFTSEHIEMKKKNDFYREFKKYH